MAKSTHPNTRTTKQLGALLETVPFNKRTRGSKKQLILRQRLGPRKHPPANNDWKTYIQIPTTKTLWIESITTWQRSTLPNLSEQPRQLLFNESGRSSLSSVAPPKDSYPCDLFALRSINYRTSIPIISGNKEKSQRTFETFLQQEAIIPKQWIFEPLAFTHPSAAGLLKDI